MNVDLVVLPNAHARGHGPHMHRSLEAARRRAAFATTIPGNLRWSADPRQGLAAEQMDPEFFQFALGGDRFPDRN